MMAIFKKKVDGLIIVHLNIQSLRAHIDEFRLDMSNKVADIILLSESWLNDNISDNFFENRWL